MAIDQEYSEAWEKDPEASIPVESEAGDDYTAAWEEGEESAVTDNSAVPE
jgi:hypothetical protein